MTTISCTQTFTKKSGLNVKKNYLKYNYFWPIGGAVTKLIENCHGIVAQNKEKYLISVGQSIVSVVNLLQVQKSTLLTKLKIAT